jgi:multiple sugar transport system substrate-binding protein
MSYKSKIATSILALAGLAMVAGCGENSSSVKSTVSSEPATTSSTPATSSSSAPEVLPTKDLAADITFWHTIGKANLDVLNTMITEFNKVYPNIHITTTSQGGYDQLKDTISNAIPAGTQPTMAYCYPDHVAEYLAAGAVTKIDSLHRQRRSMA